MDRPPKALPGRTTRPCPILAILLWLVLALPRPMPGTDLPDSRSATEGRPSSFRLDPDFLTRHRDDLARLFRNLDPNNPSLRPALDAFRRNQPDVAADELLRHFQSRPSPLPNTIGRWMRAPLGDEERENARDAMEYVFSLQGVRGRLPFLSPNSDQEPMNWEWRGPREDKEWAWLLNRHPFLPDLAKAYLSGECPRCAEMADRLWRDWMLQHPSPRRLSFSPGWRALEVARRMIDSWPQAFAALQDAPQWSAETRLLALVHVLDHAQILRHHASFWGGNHLLTEKTALALLSLFWPEFAGAEEWLQYAIAKTEEEIFAQTYADGTHKELTNHYQRVVLLNLQRLLEAVHESQPEAIPHSLLARAEAMWNYFAYVMQPEGWGPLNNASDLEHNATTLLPVISFYNRPDWEYVATGGHSGAAPTGIPSRRFPWAGQFVSRSGWHAGALWSFFEAGPHGTAHQHEDRLHLSLRFGGKDFLVDGGRYTYQPGPWRDHFRGPLSHNIVLINGHGPINPPLSARKEPLAATSIIAPHYDYFAAESRFPGSLWKGTGPSRHRRGVLFLRGFGWIVRDQVLAFGPQEVTTQWHFHPDRRVEWDGATVRTVDEAGPNLELKLVSAPGVSGTFSSARGQESPTPLGWYAPHYNTRRPTTTVQWKFVANSPSTTTWVLSPIDPSGVRTLNLERQDDLLWIVTCPGSASFRILWDADLRNPPSIIRTPAAEPGP